MKKGIIVMLISALFFVSCTKEDASDSSSSETLTLSETPSAIISYLDENYPDASISSILKSGSTSTLYYVTLDTYEQFTFDKNGKLIVNTETGTLCDTTGGNGGHHGHGNGHHGGGHHGGGHNNGISLDSLPSAISEYVTEQYSGYNIHNAKYDSLCQFGVVINVMLDSLHSAHQKLIFDTAGLFLASVNRVDSTEIPAAVLTAITTNFPGYNLRHKAELLTLADGSLQYRLFLKSETDKVKVILLADGSIVCED